MKIWRKGHALEELNLIEKYINTKDDKIIKYLIKLEDIGNKLSDFEEIESNGKKYSYLGKGNFGYTEKMKSKKNNKIYAIKKLVKNNKNFNPKDFMRETELMINLNHDNIIKFYGYFEDKENINKYKEIFKDDPNIQNEDEDKEVYCLVMEYAQNGSLEGYYKEHMKKCENNFIPIEQEFIIKILKQLLDALL